MNNFSVGKVSFVKGTTTKAVIAPHLNKMSYFYDGKTYRGIAINEFVIIRKGYLDLVGKIEGEEILELKNLPSETPDQNKFNRYIEIRIIGYLDNNKFNQGIKYLPMIGDDLYLINDLQLEKIYDFRTLKKDSLEDIQGYLESNDGDVNENIFLGKTVLENQPIYLPINNVFASHIGIFGNTGSGKSNTLAKLYVSLFEDKASFFKDKSTFLLIDFNGEYENIHIVYQQYSSYLKLSTQVQQGSDKLEIDENEFWNEELLSVLYSATEKTQKPFLSHLVRNKNRSQNVFQDKRPLSGYFQKTLERVFGANQHRETYNLFSNLLHEIATDQSNQILSKLKEYSVEWFVGNTDQNKFTLTNISSGTKHFINSSTDIITLIPEISELDLDSTIKSDPFKEVTIRSILQLLNSTAENFVQYEHISPLINKISAIQKDLSKVIKIVERQSQNSKPIQVLSLRDCNAEMKKTIAMLLAKTSFNHHKKSIKNSNTKSFHFIIDEAHNILSEQSARETASWKDYRLELFEEIIKEGRKFGFFVTIASQRPADISPTIISQLHNYFLHRLVNENDLNLLKNAISTLDASSRSLIPILPPGGCVVSGVAFHTPVIVQIEQLTKEKAPKSETIDLITLWNQNN